MCLAMPAQVMSIPQANIAVVNIGGVEKSICLDLVDNVAVGDYVIIHVGYALSKLDEDEAEKTLALFAEMASVEPDNSMGSQ